MLHAGQATFGDISRWTPPSRAIPDGSGHFNRGEPVAAAAGEDTSPDPSNPTPEGEARVHAPPLAPAHAVSGDWLDSSPFRPPEPPG